MPHELTDDDVREVFPDMATHKGIALVLIEGQIFKREEGRWRLLDDKPHRSTSEMTGTEGDNGRCRVELVNGSS